MSPKTTAPGKKRSFGPLFELALALAAAGAFGFFIYRSHHRDQDPANPQSAIAHVEKGLLERKRFGRSVFSEVSPRELLYHRDAVWVPEGAEALIVFDEGTEILAKSRTFLILMRSLENGSSEERNVELLKGEVLIKATKHTVGGSKVQVHEGGKTVLAQSDRDTVVRSEAKDGVATQDFGDVPAPSPVPSAGTGGAAQPPPVPATVAAIYPKEGTLFYLTHGQQTLISFSWPKAVEGVLFVSEKGGAEVARTAVGAERSAKLKLTAGKAYVWVLKDRSGKALVGPSEFRLLPYDDAALKSTMQTNTNQVIEMIY